MAVVLAGFMFAGSVHPPGELTMDGVMSEYGVDGFAAASVTVPADMLFEQSAGFLALPS